MTHLRFLPLIAAATFLAVSPVRAEEIRVSDNLFLIKDEPGTPLQFQMIVDAGSDDEEGQVRGLAHYLEHLILVGRNPEHRDTAIRFFEGGYSNGRTTDQVTVYIHRAPLGADDVEKQLSKLFEFYAARLRDFSIDPGEAERERNVVLQEYNLRVGSRPLVNLIRDLDARLIPSHVSGQWGIGTPETIRQFTLYDARAFHRTWYVSNNVNFVVKADIEPNRLQAIAARALANISPRPLPPRNFDLPIPIDLSRETVRRGHSEVQRASVVYKKLIRLDETDRLTRQAAMMLLHRFLAGHLPGSANYTFRETNRLAAENVHIELERAAPGYLRLSIIAACAPGIAPDTLLAAIEKWVDHLSENTVSEDALARLKARFAQASDDGDKVPQIVFDRLARWLAEGFTYPQYLEWRGRVAALPGLETGRISAALAGPGKIVSGILEPNVKEIRQ